MVVNAAARCYYTSMAHNAAYSLMMGNVTRMNLLNNCSNMNIKSLAHADSLLATQQLQNELKLKIAEANLESLKNQKKSKLNVMA